VFGDGVLVALDLTATQMLVPGDTVTITVTVTVTITITITVTVTVTVTIRTGTIQVRIYDYFNNTQQLRPLE
jgi:hypothetical protein